MWPLDRPPALTGSVRIRLSRVLKRPIVEVEESQDCIRSLNAPITPENTVQGFAWRRAKAADLLKLGSRAALVP